MEIDLIVCQPYHVDYPLFRHKLERYLDHVQHVYIALTQQTMPEPHYAQFIMDALPFVRFVKPSEKYDDWRNNAVKDVLDNFSRSSHVLFIEQDFLIKDPNDFFYRILAAARQHDIVCYDENGRIHPAFALVKRELINKTSMNFSVHPTIDHFGFFFKELLPLGSSIELKELRLENKVDFYHIAGLTHNFYNFWHDAPLYKQDEWVAYNYLCQGIKNGFKQSPQWMLVMQEIENKYGKGDYEGFLKDFFPSKPQKEE